MPHVRVAHLPGRVLCCAPPWTAARQASPSLTVSQVHPGSCPLNRWCHALLSPSAAPPPPAFSLSQHHRIFQWVSSAHQEPPKGILWPHVTFDQSLSGPPCLPKDHPPHLPAPSLSASVHAGHQKEGSWGPRCQYCAIGSRHQLGSLDWVPCLLSLACLDKEVRRDVYIGWSSAAESQRVFLQSTTRVPGLLTPILCSFLLTPGTERRWTLGSVVPTTRAYFRQWLLVWRHLFLI